jgi:hypothetical protein
MSRSFESEIEIIMQRYPESEWLAQCKAMFPDASDGEILSVIEILSGGDIEEIQG